MTFMPSTPEAGKQLDTGNGVAPAAPKEAPTDIAANPEAVALAKQHKILRQQQKYNDEQKRRNQERDTKWAELETKAQEAERLKQRLKDDPYGALLDLGLTSDQVAAQLLNQPNPVDQKLFLLEKKLAEYEEKFAKLSTGQEEWQNNSIDVAKKMAKHEIKTLVANDEAFEMVKAYGEQAEDAVVELMHESIKAGIPMDAAEALKEVEEHLINEYMKFSTLKKVQAKFAPPVVDDQAQKITPPSQKQPIQTLSNRMVQSAAKPLSDKERVQRAIDAFNRGKQT